MALSLSGRAPLQGAPAPRLTQPNLPLRPCLPLRPSHRACGIDRRRRPQRATPIAALQPFAAAAASPPALALGLALAALAAFAAWLRRRSSGDLGKLPGPKQLPLLGNLLEVGHSQSHQTIQRWANQFGHLVSFKLVRPSVLISDPREIEAILSRRGPDELPKPPLIYAPLDPIYSPTSTPSFFTTKDREMWAAVRKGCAPAFSPEATRRMFPVVRDVVGEVCEQLAARARTPEAAGGLDMQDASLRVAFDSFALTALGRDFGARRYEKCELLEILPTILAEFSARAVNPLRGVGHALMPWSKEASTFSRNLKASHAIWAELAAEVRATDLAAAEAAGDNSLRVCLARLKDPKTGQPLTLEQLAPNVAAFLVAGFETTAHSVAWALYEIARHPEVQSKLAAELDAAGLAWAPGKPGRPLEQADLSPSALPYLDQVWREALRLHSVGSVGPLRQTDREITLRSGARIPKGTILWLSAVALHTSRHNFREPERFWPERWQQVEAEQGQQEQEQQAASEAAQNGQSSSAAAGPEEQQLGAAAGSACPFAALTGRPTPAGNSEGRSFMPFANGPRDCIGQALANMEGKAMLAEIVSRFSFSVAPRMGTPEEVRAAEVNRLTLQSGKGCWLLLQPRDEGQAEAEKAGAAVAAAAAGA